MIEVDELMGRTLATYRMLIEQEKNLWNRKYSSLLKIFEHENKVVWNGVHYYADAASFWVTGRIRDKILVSIVLHQLKIVAQLEEALKRRKVTVKSG